LGRVDVPVVPGAAGRARPVPCAQAQLREQVPACRAGRRRGVPPIDHDQPAAVPGALVLEPTPELAPAAAGDRPGQTAVPRHVRDREVFDDDHVVLADHAGAGAVQEVLPGVADLAVGAGDLGCGLAAVGRAFLAAGQAALVADQVPRLVLQVA